MTIGERIAQIRKERGLSQEAFGESLGVTRQSISKWESNTSIPDVDKFITATASDSQRAALEKTRESAEEIVQYVELPLPLRASPSAVWARLTPPPLLQARLPPLPP